MNLPRLPAILVLLFAFALAACGNKADLFMPPPPEDDELIDDWDDGELQDESAPLDDDLDGDLDGDVPDEDDEDPGLPLPVPTGDE